MQTGQEQRDDLRRLRSGRSAYNGGAGDPRRSSFLLVSSDGAEHDGARKRRKGPRPAWKQRAIVGALVLSDVALALSIATLALLAENLVGWNPPAPLAAAAPGAAAWVGARALMGLYPGYGLDEVEELRRQTFALLAAAAAVAIFVVGFGLGEGFSPFQPAIGFLGLLVSAPPLRQALKWSLRRLGLWGKPVVVVGSSGVGDRVRGHLKAQWGLGYDPVAVFEFDPKFPAEDASGEDSLEGVAELARERGVSTAVFATPNTRREQLQGLVAWAGANFRHVLVIPNLEGVTNSAVVARDLAGTFAVEIKHNLLNPWALRFKRAFDLLSAAIGGLAILPLVLVLLAVVYAESGGGPVFYRDQRLGRDGRLFPCLKFRTMVPGAEDLLQKLLREDPEAREEYEKYHKLRNDPRVTRSGRFLRKTSLDELPQLWNVLKGEMSLVGPRPYLPRESEEIGATQEEILRVPPGITGLWQVDGRANTSFRQRVGMDSYYVRDWSVWLDLVLLVKTFKTVVFGRGAY